MTAYAVQASFTRGELTPKLYDRQDFDQYQLGCAECLNWLIMRHSGVTRRPGTAFITEVKDSTKKVRLLRLEYSSLANQNYILEFGDYYMRVIKDQGLLLHDQYAISGATQTNPVRITLDNHPFSATDSIDFASVGGMTELNGNTYTVTNVNPSHTITGITQANPAVVTCSGGHNLQNGDEVRLESVGGMGEVNDLVFTVAGRTSTTFQLSGINSSAYTAYTSGGTATNIVDTFELSGVNGTGYTAYTSGGTAEYTSDTIVEITTPYSETEVQELDWATSNDVMYIAHPSYAPRRLSRTSHTTWHLNIVNFIDGPYLPKNTTANHAELGGDIIAGQLTTVTFDSRVNINNGDGFSSADLGRAFRWEKRYATEDGATGVNLNNDFLIGWGYIDAINSSTSVDVAWVGTAAEENAFNQVIVDVQNESNTPDTADGGDSDRSNWWWLGAWYGNNNWPSKVRFSEHGERIVYARSNMYPLTSWLSRTNDFENFCPSDKDGAVTDDMGFVRTLSTDGAQPIRWLADARNAIVLGTSKKINSIVSATNSEAFSPNNSKADPISSNGAAEYNPVFVDTALLFVENYGKALREMVYSIDVDGYITPDSSILSEHLLKSAINGPIAYARSPNSLVWTHTTDGNCPTLTYERDQRTVGWTEQRIAGGSADDWAVVESVQSLQGSERDELYFSVKRTINGSTIRSIEVLSDNFDEAAGDDQELAIYLDGAVTYDGAATSTLSSGFDHLRGETCGIVADGLYLGTVPVPTSGSLTLPDSASASKIVLGLGYQSRLKLLPPPVRAPDGTLLGRKKVQHEALVSLFESAQCGGIKLGNTIEGTEILERLFPETVDFSTPTKPDIITGRYRMEIEDDWENEYGPTLVVDEPYPVTVRSIGFQLEYEP